MLILRRLRALQPARLLQLAGLSVSAAVLLIDLLLHRAGAHAADMIVVAGDVVLVLAVSFAGGATIVCARHQRAARRASSTGAVDWGVPGRRPVPRVVQVIVSLLIVVVIGVALHIRAQIEPVPGGLQTTGTVAEVYATWDQDRYVYAPVVVFRAQGRTVTFRAPASSGRPAIGAPARVSYDPRHPAGAHDLNDHILWQVQFLTGVVILAFWILILLAVGITVGRQIRGRRRLALISV